MTKTKKIYAILPEEKAWEFKERVVEYKIQGGINGVLKPFILEWMQRHPRRPDMKKSSAD
jgi:hypothetical protein